jgi:GntR family transcriptional regulator, transcriptional repressor for pyruvate dehydrogenase complex
VSAVSGLFAARSLLPREVQLYDDPITMSIVVSPPLSARPQGQALVAERLSDRLATHIARQIDGDVLRPGDRLPTEQQLAGAYGVSRTVVREAVHQLKSQGLVRSRQGSGVFVTEPPPHRALAFDPKVLGSLEGVMQMVELRRVIEGEMAALAAKRASRSQVAELKRALLAIDAATDSGELGVEQDLAFHRAIGAATGNPQFVRLLGILEAHLRDAMTVTKSNESTRPDFMEQVRREHRAILDAVAAHDEKRARRAATLHHVNGAKRLVISGVIEPKLAARTRQ